MSLPDFAGPMLGYSIINDAHLKDGDVMVFTDLAGPTTNLLVIGHGAWTEADYDRETVTRIVRTGLADVLEYLGEKPGPTPTDPMPLVTGQDVLAGLRAATKDSETSTRNPVDATKKPG